MFSQKKSLNRIENFEMKKNNRTVRDRHKLNLNIPRTNQVTFSTNSLKFYGSKIWNALLFNTKTVENLSAFKSSIKNGMVHHAIV